MSGHELGTAWSSIHERTPLTAHPDGSAVTVLWPTPGTTSRCPCGNRATTDWAPSRGSAHVEAAADREHRTFGSGPAPSGAPPSAPGHWRQKSALPKLAAHGPN